MNLERASPVNLAQPRDQEGVLWLTSRRFSSSVSTTPVVHRWLPVTFEISDVRRCVLSAGSQPGGSLNSVAVAVMAEDGIDIGEAVPQVLTTDAVHESDGLQST
jgi:hypothetical protein